MNAAFEAHDGKDRAMIENDVSESDNDVDDTGCQSPSIETDGSGPSDEWPDLSPEMDSALTKLTSRLCRACQNLCRGELKVELHEYSGTWNQTGELEYHPSLSSLSESVRAGCPLCKEISESFEQRLDVHFDVRDNVTDSWYITCSLNGIFRPLPFRKLIVRFFFYDSNGQCVDDKKIGGTICKYFYPAERLGLGPEYLEYRAHEANKMIFTPSIALAKYWAGKCLHKCSHRDKARSTFLPSRLIEVRTGGGTSPNVVARLCEAEQFSQDASYLTLSHCWGGHASLTLTKGNLEALRQDIPVHQLPVLFRDALYMTSQLSIKYIWIDCFCILQDCRDDWEHEAARMGDVYQYAQFNIAASGYVDGKTSVFKERTPIPLLNFPLRVDRTLVATSATATYPQRMPLKGIYVGADPGEFDSAVTKGPLNARGWVAQERALSPGILHFTPKQMWWECRDHIFCESFPYREFTRDFERSSNPLHMDIAVGEQDSYTTWKWNKFVAFYAGTDLTVLSDRFPALTGIARRFATLNGDDFLAGFWKSDLIRSLAWKVSDGSQAKKIPREQLAPSWSWAFHCIPHMPPYYLFRRITTFSICRRILSDDLGFRSDLQYKSLVKSAVRGLEITGPLRRLPVEVEKLSVLPDWIDYGLEVHIQYDVADKSFFSTTDTADKAWQWLWEEPTHMLPLIKDGTNMFWTTSLLLSRVPGLQHQNTFRRIGVVQIHSIDQETCSKALGIDDGNDGSKPGTVFEDCGMHDLILI